jgi:WhiB family redox-sensing transcriptional regulator
MPGHLLQLDQPTDAAFAPDTRPDPENLDSDRRDAGWGDLLPCQANDPDLWFAESPSDVETAKALCRGCPARQPCLSRALQRREPWGVWGGQLFLSGVVIPHKRGRGRPRKGQDAA